MFAKPSAIQAIGVMSFGEYTVSKALSQCGVFCSVRMCHVSYLCLRTDDLSFRHHINSIWPSLCHRKIRLKLFSLITKLFFFHLDKSLSHAEHLLKSSYFLTWKSSKCYGLLENLAHKLLGIGQLSKATPLHPRLEKKLWTENTVLRIFPLRLERPLGNGKGKR